MGGDGLDEDDEAPLEEEQLPAEHGNGAADPMQVSLHAGGMTVWCSGAAHGMRACLFRYAMRLAGLLYVMLQQWRLHSSFCDVTGCHWFCFLHVLFSHQAQS